MKYDLETDIAIIGAGPAGITASLFLAKMKIKHILFEKESFPKDKICGDGLSGKVVSLLHQIDPHLIGRMEEKSDVFLGSWGVRFAAPNGRFVDIPFRNHRESQTNAPGFVARRLDFDHFLFRQLNGEFSEVHTQHDVSEIKYVKDGLLLKIKYNSSHLQCHAKIIIDAGGDRSLVARKIAGHTLQPDHYYAGLRAYYENVSDTHKENFIELHFLGEVLPGYFWIFPLPENKANVGIGMLSKDVKKKKVNLREIMLKAIAANPTIKKRFANARLLDSIKGWGLPLASGKKSISGERYLLAGDAGSLIDPFTGEGVGNAMLSGKIAAEIAARAVKKNNYSASFLTQYDKHLYAEIWDEIKLSYRLQRLVNYPWLFNFVIDRINNNSKLRDTFSTMFDNLDMRAELRSPLFYLKMMFNK